MPICQSANISVILNILQIRKCSRELNFLLKFANLLPLEFKVLAYMVNTSLKIAILVNQIVAREFKNL